MHEPIELIDFTKSHGLGNDFILIEDLEGNLEIRPELVRAVCDRHFGIGADGLLLVQNSSRADYFMNYFNADGSRAEMCGNGIRVFAKYIYENLKPEPELAIETLAGIKLVELDTEGGRASRATVDMGRPGLSAAGVPVVIDAESCVDCPAKVGERVYDITCLSMGNPHCVIFTQDIDSVDLRSIGPMIEGSDLFPDRVNVEFVEVTSPDRLRLRVWERGVGETLACGTGACAALVAASLTGRAGREAEVDLLGGSLTIAWRQDDHVLMTGEAKESFRGRINPAGFK